MRCEVIRITAIMIIGFRNENVLYTNNIYDLLTVSCRGKCWRDGIATAIPTIRGGGFGICVAVTTSVRWLFWHLPVTNSCWTENKKIGATIRQKTSISLFWWRYIIYFKVRYTPSAPSLISRISLIFLTLRIIRTYREARSSLLYDLMLAYYLTKTRFPYNAGEETPAKKQP